MLHLLFQSAAHAGAEDDHHQNSKIEAVTEIRLGAVMTEGAKR